MSDSPVEQYEIVLEEAAPEVIRLRAIDDSGNVAYQTASLPPR
jgi:hypothetical protein